MAIPEIDPYTVFTEAGKSCFIESCKAHTLYVVVSEHYVFGSCGRHITNAIEMACGYDETLIVAVVTKP